jgi:hypothetical protein
MCGDTDLWRQARRDLVAVGGYRYRGLQTASIFPVVPA